jgi:hypothetical protein
VSSHRPVSILLSLTTINVNLVFVRTGKYDYLTGVLLALTGSEAIFAKSVVSPLFVHSERALSHPQVSANSTLYPFKSVLFMHSIYALSDSLHSFLSVSLYTLL